MMRVDYNICIITILLHRIQKLKKTHEEGEARPRGRRESDQHRCELLPFASKSVEFSAVSMADQSGSQLLDGLVAEQARSLLFSVTPERAFREKLGSISITLNRISKINMFVFQL